MTPQQIDAMKLALGQLQAGFVGNAMQILREALAEHAMREVQRLGQEIEQEPVAWVKEDVCDGQYIDGRPRKIWWECNKGVGTAFYTTPPQRTWVGLTRDEQSFVYSNLHNATSREDSFWVDFANAIEAKLKEKNT